MKLTAKLLKKLIKEEVQKEGHYHDMGGEDEMVDVSRPPIPKQLTPKEKFEQFSDLVELNNLSREDIEMMTDILFSEVMNVPLSESPSMEHITPENIQMVISILKDLGLLITPMAGAALGINRMLNKTGEPEVSEK